MDEEAREFALLCKVVQELDSDEELVEAAVFALEKASGAVVLSGRDLLQDAVKFSGEADAVDLTAWLHFCDACIRAAFGPGAGVLAAANLGRRLPNFCAPWLVSLKNIASAAALASDAGVKQLLSAAGTRKNSSLVAGLLGETVPRSLLLSLDSVWPELGGIGGFKASRWRARLAAVELASFMAVNFASSSNFVLENLLECLVFGLAVAEPSGLQQVKLAAIDGAKTIVTAKMEQLSSTMYSLVVGGMLATCVDPVPEVQKAGFEAVRKVLLLSSPENRREVILEVVDKFVKAFLANPVAASQGIAGGGGLNGLSNVGWLLDSVRGIINLLLLPGQPFYEQTWSGRSDLDRMPLLLVTVAAAVEEAQRQQHGELAGKLENLIRSMGKARYRASLLAMLNPDAAKYTGVWAASFYEEARILGDGEIEALQMVSRVTVLRGLSIALHGPLRTSREVIDDFPSYNDLLPASPGRPELAAAMELKVWWHILEALQVPAEITGIDVGSNQLQIVKDFMDCAYPVLQITSCILEDPSFSLNQLMSNKNLVQGLLLAFAGLASGEAEQGVELPWTSTVLRKASVRAADSLSKTLQFGRSDLLLKREGRAGTETLKTQSAPMGVAGLILALLPDMLPKIKENIESSSVFSSKENIYISSEGGDVRSAIIASHQLAWFLGQVKHPYAGGLHCPLVMACSLAALNHFSPAVKRPAMWIFVHLADNLNPSELRWYGKVTLEAVSRSLIGCDNLWPIAIQMAVKLVTCIEGRNPRASGYRQVLVEMLGELERNPNDQARRIVWLEAINPLLEAMGLVLVAHFRQLLPILFKWLHALDDKSCTLALGVLRTVILNTWCRIPFHANRIWGELVDVYKNAEQRKLRREIEAEIREICVLLFLCGRSKFDAWKRCGDDASIQSLVQYVRSRAESGG